MRLYTALNASRASDGGARGVPAEPAIRNICHYATHHTRARPCASAHEHTPDEQRCSADTRNDPPERADERATESKGALAESKTRFVPT